MLCLWHSCPPATTFVLFFSPLISQPGTTKAFVRYIDKRGAYVDPQTCQRKRRKLACILPSFPAPPSVLFFRLDYASRHMVPVCWLFSIHFLSSQTATLPPPPPPPHPHPHIHPLSPSPLLSTSLSPPPSPSSNGSSVMWVEIIFYCPVVRK